jgi:hypothetical protein
VTNIAQGDALSTAHRNLLRNSAMAIPLHQFMSQLLRNCEGSIELVVDNARRATKHTLLIPLSLPTTSNHSTTRWDCVEPSPALGLQIIDPCTRRELIPNIQRRSPIIVTYKNAIPACPIRKLSRENEMGERGSSVVFGPDWYPPLCRDSNGFFQVPRLPNQDSLGRPPLSPKKKFPVQKSASSFKMQLTKKWAQKEKLNPLGEPTSASPTTKTNQCIRNSSYHDKMLTPDLLETTPALSPKTRDPLRATMSLGTLLQSPARSLSKTLFGSANKEQAPIQPMRKPSTTPSPVPFPKELVSTTRLSEDLLSTDIKSLAVGHSKFSMASQGKEFQGVSPGEPRVQTTQIPAAKKTRKRQFFLRRSTTRR